MLAAIAKENYSPKTADYIIIRIAGRKADGRQKRKPVVLHKKSMKQ
jgi:hypothetical protein